MKFKEMFTKLDESAKVGEIYKDSVGNEWKLVSIDAKYHFIALDDASDMKKGRKLELTPMFFKKMIKV